MYVVFFLFHFLTTADLFFGAFFSVRLKTTGSCWLVALALISLYCNITLGLKMIWSKQTVVKRNTSDLSGGSFLHFIIYNTCIAHYSSGSSTTCCSFTESLLKSISVTWLFFVFVRPLVGQYVLMFRGEAATSWLGTRTTSLDRLHVFDCGFDYQTPLSRAPYRFSCIHVDKVKMMLLKKKKPKSSTFTPFF